MAGGCGLALLIALVAGVLVVRSHDGAGPGNHLQTARHQAVPVGWRAESVGGARVAVPTGWSRSSTGAGGITAAVWSPDHQAAGRLPSRCALQERPAWLGSFAAQPVAALSEDLISLEATATADGLRVRVRDLRTVAVPGTRAALAFDSTTTDAARPDGPELASVDLLAEVGADTEVHLFCSAPSGTLPAGVDDAVESLVLPASSLAPRPLRAASTPDTTRRST